jgi:hypothetical protein
MGVPLDMLAGKGRETGDDLIRAVASDGPDGRPWPPTESNVLWVILARADGCTVWRAIELALVRRCHGLCNSPIGSNRNGGLSP